MPDDQPAQDPIAAPTNTHPEAEPNSPITEAETLAELGNTEETTAELGEEGDTPAELGDEGDTPMSENPLYHPFESESAPALADTTVAGEPLLGPEETTSTKEIGSPMSDDRAAGEPLAAGQQLSEAPPADSAGVAVLDEPVSVGTESPGGQPNHAVTVETVQSALAQDTDNVDIDVEERGVSGAPPQTLSLKSVVAGRYVIVDYLSPDDHRLAAMGDGSEADYYYIATDKQGYAHCWSCGSTENTADMRFCQSCGAGLADHPLILAQTHDATGNPDEVREGASFFHVVVERRRFGAAGISLVAGGYSAEGPHHPNEDSYWYATSTICGNSMRQSQAVLVLADGMGGYRPGSGLISRAAAMEAGESLWQSLAPYRRDESDLPTDDAVQELLRHAIASANNLVLTEIDQRGYDMGCTMIVVAIIGDRAHVANIGDSRAYYLSPTGRDTQLTEDQSDVGERVRRGLLAPEDVYTAIGNNIILHAIGEPGVENSAGLSTQILEPASYLILCTDGYWKTERGIPRAARLLAETPSLEEAARTMVNEALDHNSDDNTTVVIMSVRG